MTEQATATKTFRRAIRCGFCTSGYHFPEPNEDGTYPKGGCAGTLEHTGGVIWRCACECNEGHTRCITCRRRDVEVDDRSRCLDHDGCAAYVQNRRESDPLLADIMKAKQTSKEKEMAEKSPARTTKATKPAKEGRCLVTGEPTKGGLFKPGMDARYVSMRVQEVLNKEQTEAQAKKRMKDDGVSASLVAKFEKSLGLARERAAKAKEAEKAKKAAEKA